MRGHKAGALAGVIICGIVAPCSAADVYPVRPLRFIVPFAPGGTTDILARIIGNGLTQTLRQGVVIDNRAGAGGIVGMELGAKAPPDGYTIVMGYLGTLAINPGVYKKLPYDPIKDYVPVTLAARSAQAIVANPTLPARNAKELIALARAKPGQLTYASAGIGSPSHLAGELFKTMGGVDLVHVPYKGSGAALTDLISGQVSMSFGGLAAAVPQVKAGKLRIIAVTTANRIAALPDVPTVAEGGIPGFEVTSWFGVLTPARTPDRIIRKLQVEIAKILFAADVRDRLAAEGAEVVGNTPEQFAAFIKTELQKWAPVIKAARIEVQ